MKRTLDDLRGALHEAAYAAAHPDIDALVSGARRRVAATRRRRLAVLGAVTAAVLVVGGMATTRLTHQALPQPAVPPTAGLGPFTVSAGGSGFPDYAEGMKRLTMLDAPMLEQLNGSISIPTTAGQRLFVAMTCTPVDNTGAKVAEWLTRMHADFTVAGSRGRRPGYNEPSACLGSTIPDALIGIATSAKTTVLADVKINHKPLPVPRVGVDRVVAPELLFKDAKNHVAIYGSVPWQGYPFPPRPADLDTNPEYAWGGRARQRAGPWSDNHAGSQQALDLHAAIRPEPQSEPGGPWARPDAGAHQRQGHQRTDELAAGPGQVDRLLGVHKHGNQLSPA